MPPRSKLSRTHTSRCVHFAMTESVLDGSASIAGCPGTSFRSKPSAFMFGQHSPVACARACVSVVLSLSLPLHCLSDLAQVCSEIAMAQVHDHVVLAILEMCQCVPASVILPEVTARQCKCDAPLGSSVASPSCKSHGSADGPHHTMAS